MFKWSYKIRGDVTPGLKTTIPSFPVQRYGLVSSNSNLFVDDTLVTSPNVEGPRTRHSSHKGRPSTPLRSTPSVIIQIPVSNPWADKTSSRRGNLSLVVPRRRLQCVSVPQRSSSPDRVVIVLSRVVESKLSPWALWRQGSTHEQKQKWDLHLMNGHSTWPVEVYTLSLCRACPKTHPHTEEKATNPNRDVN